ncbi:MAG: signal peptidase I [Chloroflexota bacterium]
MLDSFNAHNADEAPTDDLLQTAESSETSESYNDAAPESGETARPQLVSHRRLRRDIVETILLVIVIYTLVNLTTARAIVEGPSMQPNFYTGQLVIINRFAYYFAQPQRGDVVVLHNPRQDCQAPERIEEPGCEDLIKRLIGQPGETVEIKQGRVYINSSLIEEPYIREFCRTGCDGAWTLKADEYLVLGDNRNNSYDGHSFGPISRHLLVGQAWIRYWPPQDANVIPHPVYPFLSTK